MKALRNPFPAVVAAMVAFAANSILCRLALREPAAIDPATFTTVRLVSGAMVLTLIAAMSERRMPRHGGSWTSAAALFTYAIAFSVAYVGMTAGTGALILFPSVHLTMTAVAIARGERPTAVQWLGLVLALSGLVMLAWPGVSAPAPLAALLMALAGLAWAVYSLRGGKSSRPLADTAGNFVRAAPLAIVVSIFALRSAHITFDGLLLAIASGAIASGLGYSVWYLVLPHLTATRAAVVQLAVPVIAATGGIVLLGEHATIRFAIASVAILSGVAMAVLPRLRRAR